jgi:hypothetical protein
LKITNRKPMSRQARAKATLLKAGGKRISLNLPAELVASIERKQARTGETMTSVILGACKRLR